MLGLPCGCKSQKNPIEKLLENCFDGIGKKEALRGRFRQGIIETQRIQYNLFFF